MERSATATSLLALALGLLGATLLTVIPLAAGYAARGSPAPALALLALAVGGWAGWRLRNRAATLPPAPRRADSSLAPARAALLALPEFTLSGARQATGLEMSRLEPLLDDLLARGELRAETRGETVVYVRNDSSVSRSAP